MAWGGSDEKDLISKSRRVDPEQVEAPGPPRGRAATAGLMGKGTGSILVLGFALALHLSIKVAVGSSLSCSSVNAPVGSLLKLGQGYVALEPLPWLCLSALLGSQVGASLNGRFSPYRLTILFSALLRPCPPSTSGPPAPELRRSCWMATAPGQGRLYPVKN